MSKNDVAIRVSNLVKEYEVYAKPLDLAIEVLTRRPRHAKFRAIDNLSFEVKQGEVFGIIGSNGAGKSTLLKIITGVLEASSGTVDVSGRVTAILELGLGFNPEYAGRDNIYLSGLLYGMDRKEVDKKIDEIIDFSGLGEFIDRPVKTYSSGMMSRLAFSIATAVDPEVLIIDEALAAGDSAFVQKCLKRIRRLCSGGRTVLLVSHGTGLLAQLCQRVMWMENGKVRMIGSGIQVVQAYDLAAHQSADSESWIETVDASLVGLPSAPPKLADDPKEPDPGQQKSASASLHGLFDVHGDNPDTGRQVFRRGPVFIDHVELLNEANQPTTHLTLLRPFKVKVTYHVDGELPEDTLGVAMAINNKADLSSVAQYMTQNIRPTETRETYSEAPDREKPFRKGVITYCFDHMPFRKGEYIFSIGLLPNQPGGWNFYEYRHLFYTFTVDDVGMDLGAPMVLRARVVHHSLEEPGAEPAPANRTIEKRESSSLRGEIERICMQEGGYPDRWPRHDLCPACGSSSLYEAFQKYGFGHSRCASCGFVFVNPFPTDDVIRKLYDGQYYTQIREHFELPRAKSVGEGSPYSAPRILLEKIVAKTTEGKPTGSWLDVGGGLGSFANLVQEMRIDWTVTLNELNTRSAELASELFGLDVVSDDVGLIRGEGEGYDVISSVAVLEHVARPADFLRAYSNLLRPGGKLVTVVPHFTELNATVSKGSSGNVVPPYHLSLFGRKALTRLLEGIENLNIVEMFDYGPAAFNLIEHVDYGDYWDVTIPDGERPEPASFKVHDYSEQEQAMLNLLSQVNEDASSFFAESDGRLYLVAICERQ